MALIARKLRVAPKAALDKIRTARTNSHRSFPYGHVVESQHSICCLVAILRGGHKTLIRESIQKLKASCHIGYVVLLRYLAERVKENVNKFLLENIHSDSQRSDVALNALLVHRFGTTYGNPGKGHIRNRQLIRNGVENGIGVELQPEQQSQIDAQTQQLNQHRCPNQSMIAMQNYIYIYN